MSLQAGTSTFEVVDEELKRKRHAEEVQSEREHKKIDAHTALAKRLMQSELKTNSQQSGQCLCK